jgi:RNA polymerase sigma-32 factor
MSGTALAFPTPASLGSLDHYIQAVNRFPLLTAEQELALGRRLKEENDLGAARELVLSHLRLVVAVSRNYMGYGLPQADLIQEGNVGLMKAVRRFDSRSGAAAGVVRAALIRAECTSTSCATASVKLARTTRRGASFLNLRAKRLDTLTRTGDDIAGGLNVKREDVLEMDADFRRRHLADPERSRIAVVGRARS